MVMLVICVKVCSGKTECVPCNPTLDRLGRREWQKSAAAGATSFVSSTCVVSCTEHDFILLLASAIVHSAQQTDI